MPTNRELFFRYQKEGIPNNAIFFALQQVNGYTHSQLTMYFDQEIKDYIAFSHAMGRYQNGEMLEYIFNKAYFLSQPFYVTKDVLIPRQETEQLVLLALKKMLQKFRGNHLRIADICTGSGAIGISMSIVQPDHAYYLTDIDKKAIEVAEKNIINFDRKKIHTYVGDMLKPLILNKISLDVIVCNPPYIDDISTINYLTWKEEPHLALLANPATKFYELIFQEMAHVLNERYLLCFEIGEDMEIALTTLIKQYCPTSNYTFEKDIYGKTRFLFVENKD